MQNNSATDERPRRLVVTFEDRVSTLSHVDATSSYDSSKLYNLISDYDPDRPQLVHYQYPIERPSRLVRFATHLGLAKGPGDERMIAAVQNAYVFITTYYAPGDQVILVTRTDVKWKADANAKAVEILARHLYDGTSPEDSSTVRPINRRENIIYRVPIYGVVVSLRFGAQTESLSTWSNGLKLILPPGIQHIVCYDQVRSFRSCSTTFDLDGTISSRELRFLPSGYSYEPLMDVTKHVLYYREDLLPKWDRYHPVWTHVLSQPSSQIQGLFPLESIESVGMLHHELQRHQGLPGIYGDGSMLVWKSDRGEVQSTPNLLPLYSIMYHE